MTPHQGNLSPAALGLANDGAFDISAAWDARAMEMGRFRSGKERVLCVADLRESE